MSKSTVDDFELGNLMFGNSRGVYNFPDRDLVDSPEWNELCKVLQVEDYHFVIGDYYLDYDKDCNKERTNKLEVTPYGGYICKDDNGEIVFETFPYWWGDCTCGAEEYNENLEEELLNKFLTKEERDIFEEIEDWCDDDCPACDWKSENENKTPEELDEICTCGTREKNKILLEKKTKINNKVNAFYKEYEEKAKEHDKNCLNLKHNFVYHSGREDEIWIDWYKYPFRDSHTNIELSCEQFKEIIKDCIKWAKKDVERLGGVI